MNTMNKCAKFHKDNLSGKKVKFNLPSANWTFGEGRFSAQICIKTSCKRPALVANLTNFSCECFDENFTDDASLPHLYRGAKSQKWPKSSNQGGGGGRSCLSNCAQGKTDTKTNFVVTVGFTTKVDHQTTSKTGIVKTLRISATIPSLDFVSEPVSSKTCSGSFFKASL